jgi:hypothetical protein
VFDNLNNIFGSKTTKTLEHITSFTSLVASVATILNPVSGLAIGA